jgi:DNA-binding IclR family transcriptional regulator
MNDNRSVQRCLALLRAFRAGPIQKLSDLSRAVDLPHSTVLRFLNTLEKEGYVRKQQTAWALTPQMLELGFAALESMGVNEHVQSTLQALADQCSGTANLGEKNREEVIIIGRATAAAERRKLLVMNLHVGSTLPTTSALFTALTLAADQWSITEYPEGNHVSAAIPIHISEQRVLSLGVSMGRSDYSSERIEQEIVPLLQRERLHITQLLRLGSS